MIISKEIRELAKAMGIETEGNGTSDAIRDLTKAVKEGRVQLGGGAKSWHDLEDRPFGEEVKTEYDVLYDNVTVSANGTLGEAKFYSNTDWGEVNKFDVIFDGVEYNYEFELADNAGYNYKFGNLSLADPSAENTGEPFCLESYFFFNVDDMSQDEADKIYLAEPGVSHTLTIKKKEEQTEIKLLDKKFLPEALQFGEETVVEYNTVCVETMTSGENGNIDSVCELYTGDVCRITINDEVFDNVEIVRGLHGDCGADFGDYHYGITVAEGGNWMGGFEPNTAYHIKVESIATETVVTPVDEKFIVLTSPNGTKYNLSVADDGTLSAVAAE